MEKNGKLPWPIPVSISEPSILWFRFPFCGSGFHFMVLASILWFRLPFCGSGFHFADLASFLQVCFQLSTLQRPPVLL